MSQHAADYIKQLIAQRKASDPAFSVQRMCDDLNLPKSTIDKFLARQTVDTAWSNVSAMVSYLGGSLDHLAGIQREQIRDEAARQIQQHRQDLPPPSPADPIRAQYPALALLVESYEKEIKRSALERDDYLDRFRRLIDESRDALVSQHTAAYSALSASCQESLAQQKEHLDAAIRSRNVWRTVAMCLIVAFFLSIIIVCIYCVWEFSDPYTGLTGDMLQRAGLLPTPSP